MKAVFKNLVPAPSKKEGVILDSIWNAACNGNLFAVECVRQILSNEPWKLILREWIGLYRDAHNETVEVPRSKNA